MTILVPTLYGDKYPHHPDHPRVGDFIVRETQDKGMALHCLKTFQAGDVMARYDGITTSIVTQHSLQQREADANGPAQHILDTDFIGMLAHSCDPNVRLDMRRNVMVALKEIWPGEVLSMDYAATEAVLFRCFPCSCGSYNCRGYITGYAQNAASELAQQAAHASGRHAEVVLKVDARDAIEQVRNAINEIDRESTVHETPQEYRGIERHGILHYGQHMMVSAYGCSDVALSVTQMKSFLSDLADAIGMVRFGDAHVHRFGQGHEIGLSGFQLIETSQVSFHSNDAHRDVYLDVFSCREFSEASVIRFVQKRLKPQTIDEHTYWRR